MIMPGERIDLYRPRRPAVTGVSVCWLLVASCTDPATTGTRAPPARPVQGAAVAASANGAPTADATAGPPDAQGSPSGPQGGDLGTHPVDPYAAHERPRLQQPSVSDPRTNAAHPVDGVAATLDDAASLALLTSTALGDGDSRVRVEAVYEIGALRASRAVPVLEQALSDPAPAVRRAAVESLAAIGGEEVRHALGLASQDVDPAVRGLALDAIAEIEPVDGQQGIF